MTQKYKQLQFTTLPKSFYSDDNGEKLLIKLISTGILDNWNENKKLTFNGQNYLKLNQVSIHRNTLRKEIGREYRKSVDALIAKDYISVLKDKEGKELYSYVSNHKNFDASKKKGRTFTKSYSLSEELFYEVKNKIEQVAEIYVPIRRTKKNKDLKIKENKPKKEINYMKNYNNNQITTKKSLDELYIDKKVYDCKDYDYFDVRNNNLINQLNTKTSVVKERERLFHPVIMMKRELRQFVRHESGEELVIIDAASLNPTMMAKFFRNEQQKEQWMKHINSGKFYTELMSEDCSKKDFYKSRFCVAMSDKEVKGKGVAAIRNVIKTQFSDIQEFKDRASKANKSVNSVMLKLESKIFRNEKIINSGKFNVSMHDGLLVKKSDLAFFLKLINIVAEEVLGHKLLLTTEAVIIDETTVIEPFESVHSINTPDKAKKRLKREKKPKI